jgi:hypothetical protein
MRPGSTKVARERWWIDAGSSVRVERFEVASPQPYSVPIRLGASAA